MSFPSCEKIPPGNIFYSSWIVGRAWGGSRRITRPRETKFREDISHNQFKLESWRGVIG